MKTSGVYHIQIAVSDLERSLAFYTGLLGMEELFRADETVFLRTPGARELLALQPVEGPVDPKAGGMDHFGFYVTPEDLDVAVAQVRAAGVEVLEKGSFAPGVPFAYIKDPDGYTVELSGIA